MITVTWNEYKFKVIQYGLGTFTCDMKGHRHSSNSYELHYIVGGEGVLTTESKSYKLKKGDFFVTGPEFYHQQSTNTSNPLQEIYIYLQAFGKKTNNSLLSTFLDTTFYFGTKHNLKALFEAIIKEDVDKKLGFETAIEGLILHLLIQISRLYLPESIEFTDKNENLNDRRYLIIEQTFIDNTKDLTLSKLSERIGLCERQTERLLKKYYGKTFSELKKQV